MLRWVDLDEKEQSYDLLLEYARKGNLDKYEINKRYIPEKYHTQEFYEILVDKKPGYIYLVPYNFITDVMAKKIVTEKGSLIEYIPLEKRTKEICDIAFASSKKNIKFFPENLVNLELAESIIKEDGYLLGILPVSILTYELCLMAVTNKGTALRFVPEEFRTYELCKVAVLNDARAIRRVPIKLITEDFCKETLNSMIILPAETKKFVDKCLQINNSTVLNKIDLKIPDNLNQDSTSFSSIKIDETGMFNNEALKKLSNLGIFTLNDLFNKSREPNFSTDIQATSSLYDHIIGTIKILKCKYLNEDPLINIASLEHDELGGKLGLSTRTSTALRRSYISGEILIEIMTSMDIGRDLGRIRNLGETSLNELMTKYYIVTEYYKNKATKEPELVDLFNELQNLTRQNAEINNKIIAVMEKIKEIENNNIKGGSLK